MDFAPIFAGFVLRAHAAPFFPSRLSASAKLFHPRCQLAAEPVITDRVMKEAEEFLVEIFESLQGVPSSRLAGVCQDVATPPEPLHSGPSPANCPSSIPTITAFRKEPVITDRERKEAEDFMVVYFKSLPCVPSSRMAGDELPPLPLRLVKTKDHLPSPPCSTLATSPPTSPFASTPRGVAPSPLPELRYETTVEEACSSNTTSATTSTCSTPRSVLWQGGLTREPFEKEGTQVDAQTTQEWWGERQMGDGLAFQDVSPPVGWRERREVEEEEDEEKEEEKEVEEEEEEVPPPIISLHGLVAAMDLAWHGAREERGGELLPWTQKAIGEVAWWAGAVAMHVGRTMPKWRWNLDWCRY